MDTIILTKEERAAISQALAHKEDLLVAFSDDIDRVVTASEKEYAEECALLDTWLAEETTGADEEKIALAQTAYAEKLSALGVRIKQETKEHLASLASQIIRADIAEDS